MEDQHSDQNQLLVKSAPGTDLFPDATHSTARHSSPPCDIITKIVHSMPSSSEDRPAATSWTKRHFTTPSGKQTTAAARPRLSVTIPPPLLDSDEVHTLPHVAHHVPFQVLSSRSPHPAAPSLVGPSVQSPCNDRAAGVDDLSGGTPRSFTVTMPRKPTYSHVTTRAADNATYRAAVTRTTSSSSSDLDLSDCRPNHTTASLTVTRTPSRITERVTDLEDLLGQSLSSNTASLAGRTSYSRVVGRTPIPAALQTKATHSNSKTWVNPQIKEHEKWQQIERNMKRMFHRSKCIPTTYHEYLEHRVLFQKDRQAEQARKLAALEASSHRSHPGLPTPGIKVKILPAFRGKVFNDDRSGVLAMSSIWCPWWKETEQHPQALWPCPEEMKEEGDERMTSGFRRFPAMPRLPGNATVTYKQKSPLKPEKFDKVWRKKHIFARVQAERSAEEAKAGKIEQETARLMALKAAIDAVTEAIYLGLTQSEAVARVEVKAEESASKNVAEDEAKEAKAEYEEMEALLGQSLVAAIDG